MQGLGLLACELAQSTKIHRRFAEHPPPFPAAPGCCWIRRTRDRNQAPGAASLRRSLRTIAPITGSLA